jgi:hypothetical protein
MRIVSPQRHVRCLQCHLQVLIVPTKRASGNILDLTASAQALRRRACGMGKGDEPR